MANQTKILIVEDNVALADVYEFKFQHEGFEVLVAHDGQEGLDLAKKHTPDLLLVDLMMPVMRGDEMLASLRETEWGSNARVIVMTNISRDEAPSALRFLHIDRYIVKAHHTPSQVVAAVRDVLSLPQKLQ